MVNPNQEAVELTKQMIIQGLNMVINLHPPYINFSQKRTGIKEELRKS
jgi:hypothetical protein